MRIIFVTGPAMSGKTSYIIENYSSAYIVNFSSFAKYAYAAESFDEMERIGCNAHLYCCQALYSWVKKAKEDDVFVLEHPMLKKEERTYYLETLREVTDTKVECVVILPDEDVVKAMLKKEQLIHLFEYEKEKMEMPSVEEGFGSVTIIHPEYKPLEKQS